MITHIRIQNLRSLVDTGFIEIKPLTILLGSNSSGKSTFLRSFPLFTQSVNKELREPISWFDDALVDFGDYDTAKSKMVPEGEGIKFSYKVKKDEFSRDRYIRVNMETPNNILSKLLEDYQIEISFKKDSKGGVYVNGVEYISKDLKVGYSITEKNGQVTILVNDQPLNIDIKAKWYYGHHLALMPEFETNVLFESRPKDIDVLICEETIGIIKSRCRKSLVNTDKIRYLLDSWTIDKEDFLHILKHAPSLTTFRKKASAWDVYDKTFLSIYNNMAAAYVATCFSSIDDELKNLYGNCSYIAPMRAAADRYYRSQSLQVQNVDPYGKNLPEFISSLSGQRRANYEEFTEKVLGLKVTVENKNGHLSIVLKGKNVDANMTDVGFGYSQILPIITKLWLSSEDSRRTRMSGPGITLIEQPELHLHPAMQARTADIIMLILNKMKDLEQKRMDKISHSKLENLYFFDFISRKTQLIVETHSQAMINRIGKRIREKRFKAEDVSILLFEKNQETGITNIKKIEFSETGQLTNWPYGFFEPTNDIYDILFDKQSQD